MEIYCMDNSHEMWEKTAGFAERSSWSAGPYLARMMRNNDFLPWERVFAAYENGEPVGYCSFTAKDELPDKYPYTPFIGFVFVDEKHRGQRISEKMICAAAEYAHGIGYDKVYLMSGEHGLYEKYGFIKTGDYETIYGTVDQLFYRSTAPRG